ncbi:MAG TPA: DEAD/DEAH box helicase, partial [Ruania sp.]|nr:DEAD/DEAH box helicase [Ruania sp.]
MTLSLPEDPTDDDALVEAFTDWAAGRGLSLYPHQEEALIEVVTGSHVIASTPTGSGKSLIAVAAHYVALARGQRTFYTAPLKALVSEKFFDLVDIFGAEQVGMLTGDSAINTEAPIICATAEILANQALHSGSDLDVGQVIMDEFHFYADPQRGWAWQVPLLELNGAQFVLMSATLGDVTPIAEDLTRRTGTEVAVIANTERPVPLTFSYST